ncbi:uncharacterized protein LOC116659241 [Camelus ferus]|uniref:Uncharacterized protein LOC116659241 n=1 Tax=Camelus ferus TaxID=419612 RepID=A0A8B8RY53_CAMFR|nr:uncharacterized protein LOC116659241 [Camelus ferus]
MATQRPEEGRPAGAGQEGGASSRLGGRALSYARARTRGPDCTARRPRLRNGSGAEVCGVGRSNGREPEAGVGGGASERALTRARATLHPLDSEEGAGSKEVVVELPGALPGAPSGAAQARRLEPRPCPRSGKARKTPGFQLFVRLSLLLECWKGEGVDVVARPSGFSSVSPATSLLSSKSVPRNELKHWLLDLQLAVSQMGTYTISSPGSQAFGLGLELHHQLSWVSHLLTADLETSQHP